MKHMIEFLPHIVKIEDTKPHATLAWQGTDSDEVDEETQEEVVLISVNDHPSTSPSTEQTCGKDSGSKDETDYINIKVVDEAANEFRFRVKTSTQIGKLKKSYAERMVVPTSSLRFLFHGRVINDDESPKALEMEQGDVIDVYDDRATEGTDSDTENSDEENAENNVEESANKNDSDKEGTEEITEENGNDTTSESEDEDENPGPLFALDCDMVTNKSELIAGFSEECIELLMTAENRCLPFRDFAERYREHFDKECRATDFGYQDIEKLFRAMPDTVKIIDDGWSNDGSTLRWCPGRSLIQLTRSAALSGMDCPDLCKKIPDSTEVVDVQAEDGQDQNGNEPGTNSEAEDSVDEDDISVSGMEAKAAIDLLRKYLTKGKYSSRDVDSMRLGEIDRLVTKMNVASLKESTLSRFLKK